MTCFDMRGINVCFSIPYTMKTSLMDLKEWCNVGINVSFSNRDWHLLAKFS